MEGIFAFCKIALFDALFYHVMFKMNADVCGEHLVAFQSDSALSKSHFGKGVC